jgi:CRISPR-associated endoribonuclease Cas6
LAHEAFDGLTHNPPSFEFATLTTFHQNGLSVPLPLPLLVYGSLVQAWNTFSPVPLPVQLNDFLQNCVGISRHKIATGRVSFAALEQHIGFKGSIHYIFLPQDKTPYSPDEYRLRLQTINLLTKFAFYVGVGVRTTVGMGQVRPLP